MRVSVGSGIPTFRYESVFALASLQFCGHLDEYLIANTRRLCLMYVLPRFGEQKQIIRRYEEGKLVDVIAGDFLVVGLTEDSFGSLTDDQMKRYEKKFHQPETFVKMGKSIMVLPIPETEVKRREAVRREQPVQKPGKIVSFPKEPAL